MATWYPADNPIRDFSLHEAQDFLKNDFMKNLVRTENLYVKTKPKNEIGHGMFEPIMLSMSWCDFLGALYSGDGLETREGGIGSARRSQNYIKEVMGKLNLRYVEASRELVKNYRNGLIHGYAPVRFHIRYGSSDEHLEQSGMGFKVDNPTLINDMIKSVILFSDLLTSNNEAQVRGSLIFFNKGRSELLTKKKIYLQQLGI